MSVDDVGLDAPVGANVPAEDGGAGTGLWPGDRGTLRPASRRALVQLLRGPYLSAARHSALWSALLNDAEEIQSRLADVCLDLVVDTENHVAFVRNVDADGEWPRVVRTAPLTFLDTALLLHLRQQLLTGSTGSRVIVGQDEVADHLHVYRGADNADPAGFAKRVAASWSKFVRYGLLAPTSTEGRFEISPVLRLVFGAEQVAALRQEYARLAALDGAGVQDVAELDASSDEERE